MIKNSSNLAYLLSGILFLLYLYLKTKDKFSLFIMIFVSFFIAVFIGVKQLYIPAILGLFIAGFALIAFIMFMYVENEKNQGKFYANLNSVLTINISNVLFWGFIIALNLIGFLLEG